MKPPRDSITAVERRWARGVTRPSGYGVAGLSFGCGEILSFARIASPAGVVSWLWHRDPDGDWTTYGSTDGEDGESGLRLRWTGPELLGLSVPDQRIHWTLRLSSTPRTRALTVLGLLLPRPLRLAAGSSPFVTGLLEKAGSIAVPSCRPADGESHAIEPRRVWSVEASVAVVEGRELGPIRLHARSGAPHPPAAGTRGVDAEPPVPLFVIGRVRSPEGSSVAAEPEEVRRTA